MLKPEIFNRDNAVPAVSGVVRDACYYDRLCLAHHNLFLAGCIGYRKHNYTDHPISYLDTLVITGIESTDVTLTKEEDSVQGGYGGEHGGT